MTSIKETFAYDLARHPIMNVRWRFRHGLRKPVLYRSPYRTPGPHMVSTPEALQAALDDAAGAIPVAYTDALKEYQGRRLKWLHRRPLLRPPVVAASGMYVISEPLRIPPGVQFIGRGMWMDGP